MEFSLEVLVLACIAVLSKDVTGASTPSSTCEEDVSDMMMKVDDCLMKYDDVEPEMPECVPTWLRSANSELTCEDGWLTWLRREDNSLTFDNQRWDEYKDGFGKADGNFWLGLENLHKLTSKWAYTLQVRLTDFDGRETTAEYNTFIVGPEDDQYRLQIGGYEAGSSAGDSLTSGGVRELLPDGMGFSTIDKDNDMKDSSPSCAHMYKGGWWFCNCSMANPTGVYDSKDNNKNSDSRMHWYVDHKGWQQFRIIEMRVKARNGSPCDSLMAKADEMMEQCYSMDSAPPPLPSVFDDREETIDNCFKEPYPMIVGAVAMPSGRKVPVYCSNGWLRFLRREDDTVYFDRPWAEYRDGFGDSRGEFWFGLENLHTLTKSGSYELKVEMSDFDYNNAEARYGRFIVSPSSSKYKLDVAGYDSESTAGDALATHNGMKFTAEDQDSDKSEKNCATDGEGGWWYNNCYTTLPTGRYCGPESEEAGCMAWKTWKPKPLRSISMSIRPSSEGKLVDIGSCFGKNAVSHQGWGLMKNGTKARVSCSDGWLVFMAREGGVEDFDRGMSDYVTGFGDAEDEFWMGLDPLTKLSTEKNSRLRVEVTGHEGVVQHAEYDGFEVIKDEDNFKLKLTGKYLGDDASLGDDLKMSNTTDAEGVMFSARDKDQDQSEDKNCAEEHGGGWFFTDCGDVNPTGPFMSFGKKGTKAAFWKSAYQDQRALKRIVLKMKPVDEE